MGVILAVLTTILNFIVHLLTLVAKLVYKLIRALGLQFPFLYVVVMLVADLCTRRAISSNPTYASLFWLGFVLSLLCSVCYILRRVFFPKRKRDEEWYRKKFEREQEKKRERERIPQPTASPAETRTVEIGTLPPETAGSNVTAVSPPAQPTEAFYQQTAPQVAAFGQPTSPPVQSEAFPVPQSAPALTVPSPSVQISPVEADERLTFSREKKVKYPLVYRVRQDERFLLYEYEDRTEVWFERPNGLKFVRTDPK